MTSQPLSYRAAAAWAGVTHRSISQAIKRGHLAARSDGLVDVAALDRWNSARRAPRGGKHRQVSVDTTRSLQYPAGIHISFDAPDDEALPGSPAFGVPRAISSMATFMRCAALDMAEAAARHLPPDQAAEMAREWFGRTRTAWVGPADFEPMCDTEQWQPPVAGCTWARHPLFTEDLSAAEIEEAVREGAAWRTTQELPPL